MTVERMLRIVAGAFILASLGLATWVDARFLWFTAFVGANLLQSGFTNWCPLMPILRKAGVPDHVGIRPQSVEHSERSGGHSTIVA